MDTDFTSGLIVNPSDVKVEPRSPSPSHACAVAPAPALVKYDPDIVIKQEHVSHVAPSHVSKQTSVLKPSTIVITGIMGIIIRKPFNTMIMFHLNNIINPVPWMWI